MREQSGIAVQPGPLPRGDGLTEVLGVPVDDDGGEQIETGHAVVLTLGRAIPDFALSPDAQGIFGPYVHTERSTVIRLCENPIRN